VISCGGVSGWVVLVPGCGGGCEPQWQRVSRTGWRQQQVEMLLIRKKMKMIMMKARKKKIGQKYIGHPRSDPWLSLR